LQDLDVYTVVGAVDEGRFRAAERRLWHGLGLTPTERRVRFARWGATVRVLETGEGPPVVFVHGGSNAGSSWATLVSGLEGFRCILVDRPGCGLSAPVKGMSEVAELARLADDLLADLFDAVGLHSAHVVATSYGGYFALRGAAAHPDRVDRMVQFSWPVGARAARMPSMVRLAALPGVRRLTAGLPASERGVRMIFRQLGHADSLKAGRISPAMVDWFLHLLRDTDTMRNETTLVRGFFTPLGNLNERLVLPDALLAQVRAPTLFVWGERDPLGGVDVARELVSRMPTAELEVRPGVGHAPWLDEPDYAAEAVSQFLRGQERRIPDRSTETPGA
jgi:2-hydroxy-6-oxonona-2,4-dienedioate hydrolase